MTAAHHHHYHTENLALAGTARLEARGYRVSAVWFCETSRMWAITVLA